MLLYVVICHIHLLVVIFRTKCACDDIYDVKNLFFFVTSLSDCYFFPYAAHVLLLQDR